MSKKSNSPLETIEKYLEDDGWYPKQIEGKSIFRSGFKGKNGDFRVYVQVNEEKSALLCYSVSPLENVKPDQFLRVIEFITRANYGMRIGNFELDMDDGEVRYKSSVDFENIELSWKLLENILYPCVKTLDRYLPALKTLLDGKKTAQEAIKMIEE